MLVQLDLLEFQGLWDHQDPKENLVFQGDLVVQARWDQKEKEETLSACRDLLARLGCRAAQEYSTAPKGPCSPSLLDLTVKWLLIPMEALQLVTVRRD